MWYYLYKVTVCLFVLLSPYVYGLKWLKCFHYTDCPSMMKQSLSLDQSDKMHLLKPPPESKKKSFTYYIMMALGQVQFSVNSDYLFNLYPGFLAVFYVFRKWINTIIPNTPTYGWPVLVQPGDGLQWCLVPRLQCTSVVSNNNHLEACSAQLTFSTMWEPESQQPAD